MSTMQCLKLLTFLLVLALGGANRATAADSVVQLGHPEWHYGTVRYVECYGKYSIAANEQIADVRLYFWIKDNFGNISEGQVQGTFDPVNKIWVIEYGDFELLAYQAVITVQKGTQKTPYVMQGYYW